MGGCVGRIGNQKSKYANQGDATKFKTNNA